MSEALMLVLINGLSVIFAAVITCIGVVVGAGRIADKKRTLQKLLRAYKDIQVLYTIEKYHTQMNLTVNGKCNKTHVRQLVTKQENMALSGQHTLAQVNRKIQALESSSQ
jgi:hypothetical protein|tara:strand:+ start:87976 stop:88305 length:330 start_codon:yes stop_codon:yes gene_type:complete